MPRGRPHPDLIFRVMQLTGIIDAKRIAKSAIRRQALAESGIPLTLSASKGERNASFNGQKLQVQKIQV